MSMAWPMPSKQREAIADAMKHAILVGRVATLHQVVIRVSGDLPNVSLPELRDLAVMVLAGMSRRHEIEIERIAFSIPGASASAYHACKELAS